MSLTKDSCSDTGKFIAHKIYSYTLFRILYKIKKLRRGVGIRDSCYIAIARVVPMLVVLKIVLALSFTVLIKVL